MRRSHVGVIALALAATTLTAEASAQTPAPPTAPTAPAAPAAVAPSSAAAPSAAPAPAAIAPTAVALQGAEMVDEVAAPPTSPAAARRPLRLRRDGDTAPIALAPEKSGDDWWIKALAGVALLGAGAFALRKKGMLDKPEEKKPKVEILERMSLGVRSELVVVGVDGQRLLLGVTAGGIQRLALLSEEADAATLVTEGSALGASFERLLSRADRSEPTGAIAATQLEQEIAGPAASQPTSHEQAILEQIRREQGYHEPAPVTDESPRRRLAYTIDEEAAPEPRVEAPAPRSSQPRRVSRTVADRPAAKAPKAANGGQAAALQALLAQRRRAS